MESEQDWNPKNKTEKDSVAACGNQTDDRNLAAATVLKNACPSHLLYCLVTSASTALISVLHEGERKSGTFNGTVSGTLEQNGGKHQQQIHNSDTNRIQKSDTNRIQIGYKGVPWRAMACHANLKPKGKVWHGHV